MKYILPLFLVFSISFASIAQSGSQPDKNPKTCLDKWKDIFKQRGADAIGDGIHRNVTISITDKTGTSCFVGKARVERNQVNSIFVQMEDESYELFEAPQFKEKTSLKIENGISEGWVALDGRVFHVIFHEKLKPKAKEFKKAADPDGM
jgi:hypothetical protein